MDIVCIIISCTLANHLGLTTSIESIIRHQLPIVRCSKCFTFWSVMAYTVMSGMAIHVCTAIAFASALAALWLELMLSVVDYYYIKIYENHNIEDDTTTAATASDTDSRDTSDTLPKMRQE